MNEFAGYTKAVPGGHWGMLRFARDGHPKPIMGKGEPHVFPTEVEALRAVNKHLVGYMNGPEYRRDGAKIEATSSGDAMFPGLKPIFRKGKRIAVERIGA